MFTHVLRQSYIDLAAEVRRLGSDCGASASVGFPLWEQHVRDICEDPTRSAEESHGDVELVVLRLAFKLRDSAIVLILAESFDNGASEVGEREGICE